MLAKAIASQG